MPDRAGVGFERKGCRPELAAANVMCGSVQVPEDYSNRGGRTIGLHVVVFKAIEKVDGHSAQFDLEGGPGFAVTDSAEFYATDGAIYRTHRDVVLADMRGTGGSGGLFCPNIEQNEQADPRAPLYPPALVRDCAELLSSRADLRQYTTGAAARDMDAVRFFISGALDPVTAPEWAAETATRFPAGRHVIVAQGGHVLDGMSGIDTCFDRVVPQFIEKGSAAGIDMTCFGAMQGGP